MATPDCSLHERALGSILFSARKMELSIWMGDKLFRSLNTSQPAAKKIRLDWTEVAVPAKNLLASWRICCATTQEFLKCPTGFCVLRIGYVRFELDSCLKVVGHAHVTLPGTLQTDYLH